MKLKAHILNVYLINFKGRDKLKILYPTNHYVHNIESQTNYRVPQANSFIRLFHASPGAPPVDVFINETQVAKNLPYKSMTQYLPLAQGNYSIKVYKTGETTNPIIDTTLYIPENNIFNVSIIGTPPAISIYPIPEPITAQNFGRSCIRFIHLSPNTPAVDIYMSDGTKVFNNVAYTFITNYACIEPGTYSFQVVPTGTSNVALTLPNIPLQANTYYTIYALGLNGGNPPLGAIVVTEPR